MLSPQFGQHNTICCTHGYELMSHAIPTPSAQHSIDDARYFLEWLNIIDLTTHANIVQLLQNV